MYEWKLMFNQERSKWKRCKKINVRYRNVSKEEEKDQVELDAGLTRPGVWQVYTQLMQNSTMGLERK